MSSDPHSNASQLVLDDAFSLADFGRPLTDQCLAGTDDVIAKISSLKMELGTLRFRRVLCAVVGTSRGCIASTRAASQRFPFKGVRIVIGL
jgi:hypothetical protein